MSLGQAFTIHKETMRQLGLHEAIEENVTCEFTRKREACDVLCGDMGLRVPNFEKNCLELWMDTSTKIELDEFSRYTIVLELLFSAKSERGMIYDWGPFHGSDRILKSRENIHLHCMKTFVDNSILQPEERCVFVTTKKQREQEVLAKDAEDRFLSTIKQTTSCFKRPKLTMSNSLALLVRLIQDRREKSSNLSVDNVKNAEDEVLEQVSVLDGEDVTTPMDVDITGVFDEDIPSLQFRPRHILDLEHITESMYYKDWKEHLHYNIIVCQQHGRTYHYGRSRSGIFQTTTDGFHPSFRNVEFLMDMWFTNGRRLQRGASCFTLY